MVKQCNCENQGQDKIHGNKNRVFNEVKKPNGVEYRCTVCGYTSKSTPVKK
jgi:rubrerythrin